LTPSSSRRSSDFSATFCTIRNFTQYRSIPHPHFRIKWPKLEEAVQIICGRDDFEFHDSLADCYAVLEILKVMGNSVEVNGEHRWSDIFDRVFGGKSPGMHIHSRRIFMSELSILKGYQPGSIGCIAELHGRYYSANWGFGPFFESKVARELADFVDRYDSEGDGFWIATANGRIEGSIVIDGIDAQSKGAHLRWFIVSDAYRLQGLGNRLMKTAMEFCDAKKYDVTYLWTFEGLDPARHLYEKSGFELIRQYSGRQWGTEVNEQYFERRKQTGA
jgi:GNAT superfamily N-acetyltransferase